MEPPRKKVWRETVRTDQHSWWRSTQKRETWASLEGQGRAKEESESWGNSGKRVGLQSQGGSWSRPVSMHGEPRAVRPCWSPRLRAERNRGGPTRKAQARSLSAPVGTLFFIVWTASIRGGLFLQWRCDPVHSLESSLCGLWAAGWGVLMVMWPISSITLTGKSQVGGQKRYAEPSPHQVDGRNGDTGCSPGKLVALNWVL